MGQKIGPQLWQIFRKIGKIFCFFFSFICKSYVFFIRKPKSIKNQNLVLFENKWINGTENWEQMGTIFRKIVFLSCILGNKIVTKSKCIMIIMKCNH